MKRFDQLRRVPEQGRVAGRILAALTLTLVLVALPMPAAASHEIVVNGSFEDPPIASGSFQILGSIPGWVTTFGPGIEVQNRVAGAPLAENQHVELDSRSSSGMVQTLSTVAGASYQLSFWVSPRPGRLANDNVLQVEWDGAVLDTIYAGDGGPQTAWGQYIFTVVATSTATTLAFADVGTSNSFGAYLDAVSVTGPSYGVCLLYDSAKPKKAGSVAPIKLQLCDGAGTNLSDPSLVLNVVNLVWIDGDPSTASAEDAGQANPGDDFRYDADLAGYIFNLDTNGLTTGTWQVQFTVNGGQHVYGATFDVK